MEYEYDANDRLRTVKYPSGRSTTYAYDTSDRIISAEDFPAGTIVAVEYDANQGRIARASVERRTYEFRYIRDEEPHSGHVDIIGPQREVTRVKMQGSEKGIFYIIEKVGRASSGH